MDNFYVYWITIDIRFYVNIQLRLFGYNILFEIKRPIED